MIHQPDQNDLAKITMTITTTWNAIKADCQKLNFEPRLNNLCDWCSYQNMCPLKGGQAPELTAQQIQKSLHIKV
jgi:putative RecB family exonuclease